MITDYLTIENLQLIASIVTGVGSATGVLYYGHCKVIRPRIIHAKKLFLRLVRAVELVEKELSPNGGSSLRDAIGRIESKLFNQDYRFKASMQIDKQAMFECNIDGELTWCNLGLLRLVRRSFEEIRGFGWANCIDPHDIASVKQEWENARNQSRSFNHPPFSYIDPVSHQQIKVIAYTYPIKDENNKTVSHIGVLIDPYTEQLSSLMPLLEHLSNGIKAKNGKTLIDVINSIEQKTTDIEKVTQEEFKKIKLQNSFQLAKIQTLLQEDTRGIFETNIKGECIWVNTAYHRITQRSWEEIRGGGWINIIAPEDREKVKHEWQQSIIENRTFYHTYHYIRPDGSRVKILCHTVPLKELTGDNDQVIGYLGFVSVVQ